MQFCKVCNQGSDREDWREKATRGEAIACDHHSEEEVKAVTEQPPLTAGAERLTVIGSEPKTSILSKFKK